MIFKAQVGGETTHVIEEPQIQVSDKRDVAKSDEYVFWIDGIPRLKITKNGRPVDFDDLDTNESDRTFRRMIAPFMESSTDLSQTGYVNIKYSA
jgi:hypothetical protein